MNSLGANVEEILGLFKGVTKFKVETLMWICLCIMESKTVCLWKTAENARYPDNLPSNFNKRYSRMIRFFETGNGKAILEGIFLLIVTLIGRVGGRMLLAMDRTHFENGKLIRNVLVIGAVWKNVFIPLMWIDLDKKGNSNIEERLALIDDFILVWKRSGSPMPPLLICGDREFIGDKWFMELDSRGAKFIFRLKENRAFHIYTKSGYSKNSKNLRVLRRYMNRNGLKSLDVIIQDLYIFKFTAVKNDSPTPEEPYLYLITNLDDVEEAAELYRLRWKIECCFKHFKSNGFDLECMRLEGNFKTDLIFGVVSLLYVMAIKEGMAENEINPVRQITYKGKDKKSPAKSTFKVGFAILRDKIRDFSQLCMYVYQVIVHSLVIQI